MSEVAKIEIAVALSKAQLEMGVAAKDKSNPHFKSKYADLSSVMSACMDALGKHGIAVIQPFIIGEDGKNYVDTILIHGESGSQLSCRIPAMNQKGDMQGLGSAMTYARRYGLMAMAGIAPEDDDGNAAGQGSQGSRMVENSGPSIFDLIGAAKTLADANGLIPQVNAMTSNRQQATDKLSAKVDALGGAYDQSAGAFVKKRVDETPFTDPQGEQS